MSENIRINENQEHIILLDDSGEVIVSLKLIFLKYITYQGGLTAQIKAEMIRREDCGKNYGTLFFWSISTYQDG